MSSDHWKLALRDFIQEISMNYPEELQRKLGMSWMHIDQKSDDATVLNSISQSTDLVKKYNADNRSISMDVFEDKMGQLKQNYDHLQTTLDLIATAYHPQLNNVKTQLKEFFDNLWDMMDSQNKKISAQGKAINDLQSKVDSLIQKSKMSEKQKLIADLISPLAEEIHNFLGGQPGQPHRYDDWCIYKAFQYRFGNDHESENQYKAAFEKPIDDKSYGQFYHFLLSKPNALNTSLYWLTSLLGDKKVRNFTHHSDIQDFFRDSKVTLRYKFADLIAQHDLFEAFRPEELVATQSLFETYYARQIDEARRREQAAGQST